MTCIPSSSYYPPPSWMLARRVVEGCARVCVRRKCGSGHPLLHFLLLPFLYYYDFFFLFLNPPKPFAKKANGVCRMRDFYSTPTPEPFHLIHMFYLFSIVDFNSDINFFFLLIWITMSTVPTPPPTPPPTPTFLFVTKKKGKVIEKKSRVCWTSFIFFMFVFDFRCGSFPPLLTRSFELLVQVLWTFFFLSFPFLSFLSYLSSSLPHRNVFNR